MIVREYTIEKVPFVPTWPVHGDPCCCKHGCSCHIKEDKCVVCAGRLAREVIDGHCVKDSPDVLGST